MQYYKTMLSKYRIKEIIQRTYTRLFGLDRVCVWNQVDVSPGLVRGITWTGIRSRKCGTNLRQESCPSRTKSETGKSNEHLLIKNQLSSDVSQILLILKTLSFFQYQYVIKQNLTKLSQTYGDRHILLHGQTLFNNFAYR